MKQAFSCKYLIIGAGPAGLQLGYFMQKMEWSYLVVEAADGPGAFYSVLPRHGNMISINKIYTGYDDPETQLRYDWNSLLCDDPSLRVRHYSSRYFPLAAEYQRYLGDFARRYRLAIRYQTKVVSITKRPTGFDVVDQQGNMYQCACLIVASGLGLTPSIPAIPGIELGEHYQHYSIDPQQYIDQRVLIIGKGNGAFETANELTATARIIHLCSPHEVKMAWETHFMGHVRTVNAAFLDTFYLKGQNAVLDARVERLERRSEGIVAHIVYSHADGQTMQLAYDRVLLCTGFRFDNSIFDENCQPALSHQGKLPAMSAEWESTTVEDLYFAGTLMQMRDYHKTMSNVIHGFRFNILFLRNLLALKYHQQSLPFHILAHEPEALSYKMLERASHAAGLFLQPGFLCDLAVCKEAERSIQYFENVPRDYIHEVLYKEQEKRGHRDYSYILSLEYGRYQGSTRHMPRDPNPERAANDFYLHPVVRRFHGAEQIDECHLSENLESNWLPGQNSYVLTTEVPGKYAVNDMFGYHQRLLKFLKKR